MIASLAFNNSNDDHPHICLCSVKNEANLISGIKHLNAYNIKFHAWREPDKNNELTSLTTQPLSGEQRRCMRKFNCLKETKTQGVK